MRERKSALTNGKTTAGRFLLFLVLSPLLRWAQFWPPGLFPRLRVQILLRSLFSGSPRPPLPHERGWQRASAPWGRDREGLAGQGERAARGCADHGGGRDGPAVSASSPLGGSGVFLPHGTQGRFVQFSRFDSPQGWGGGEKGKPRYRAWATEKGLPPRPSLVSPRFFKL